MKLEEKIYMLSTTDCTKCPIVKQMLATKDVEVEYVNNDDDPSLAAHLEVMSVPTIVDNRQDNETLFIGQQSCLAFVNSL